MKLFLFVFLILSSSVQADGASFLSQEAKSDVVLQNSVLAQVNGKPITLYDVKKRMDVIFYRQYKEYVGNAKATYEFYKMSWEPILKDLMDKELLKADAKEMKLEITQSELHQELTATFGPNIIANLDLVGLSMQEAKEMLSDDLLIRKIMGYKVHSKAFQKVGPKQIKEAYQHYLAQNPPETFWTYQIITCKDSRRPERALEVAEKIRSWLAKGKLQLDTMEQELARLELLPPSTTITVGNVVSVGEKELSEEYYEVMCGLEDGAFSEPIETKSRRSGQLLTRVFHLQHRSTQAVKSLDEVESMLKEQLMSQIVEEETKAYMESLRAFFCIQQLPQSPSWTPFALLEHAD